MTAPPPYNRSYWNGLQALRFFAAMMVVYHHSNAQILRYFIGEKVASNPAWGQAGVDIFFVLSGFIIVSSLSSGHVSALRFWFNRIIRIIPLYWIVTTIAFLLITFAGHYYRQPNESLEYYISSMLFIPAIRSAPDAISPLVVPGWTLQFEMLFYALAGFGLFLKRRREIVISAAILAVLALAYAHADNSITARFFSKGFGQAVILEFIFGMALARGWRSLITRERPFIGLGLIAFGFLLISAFFVQYGLDFRVLTGGLPAIIIVLGCLMSEPLWRGPMLGRAARIGGDISFSIYITHMVALTLVMRWLYLNRDAAAPNLSVFGLQALVLIGSILIGAIFHYGFDMHVQKLRRRFSMREETETTTSVRPST